MAQINDTQEALQVAGESPNVTALRDAYDRTLSDLGFYLEGVSDSYRWRRNIWAGKSRDLRKHGEDAFPWDGASDTEAHVISQRINTYVALFMSALNRANIRAYPVEVGDLGRSRVVSSFLKWMISSYIPQFKRQMEIGGNNLLERGIMITYVGWEKKDSTYKQRMSLQEIARAYPDWARIILEKSDDETVIALIKRTFRGVTDKKAKKALNDLRKTGFAELPIVRQTVDRPCVESQTPDGDWFFPAYTYDPQRAPYCFKRVLMTAQEIRNKVATEGWDSEWAEYVIAKCPGVTGSLLISSQNPASILHETTTKASEDLYEVLYAYQRLTDMEDSSEGIYCTVFHRDAVGQNGTPEFAKHYLLNGYDDYPVVVTKLSEDDKRLYEVLTVPELLRGCQWIVKGERDARVDRNSITTNPPRQYPAGQPPPDWGPGINIPYRRQNEIAFAPTPAFNPGSVEMEQTMLGEADGIMGLRLENPLDTLRQQYLVTKFLEHVRDVIKLAFKCYQRFGPDEVGFQVTGSTEFLKFVKGNPNEDFDVVINYDVLNNDPETVEARLNAFASLFQFDPNGRIDKDAFLSAAAGSIDPIMADAFLLPAEEAKQRIQKDVTDDLSKIFSGIEVPARPNGANAALAMIQAYIKQDDVAQRLANDKAFRERLQKYNDQYVFQLQQAQNAQIGRIGTRPAEMGGIQTQGMNQ